MVPRGTRLIQIFEELAERAVDRLPPPAVHVKQWLAPEEAELWVADEQGRLAFRLHFELLPAVVDVEPPVVVAGVFVVTVPRNRRVILVRVEAAHGFKLALGLIKITE